MEYSEKRAKGKGLNLFMRDSSKVLACQFDKEIHPPSLSSASLYCLLRGLALRMAVSVSGMTVYPLTCVSGVAPWQHKQVCQHAINKTENRLLDGMSKDFTGTPRKRKTPKSYWIRGYIE